MLCAIRAAVCSAADRVGSVDRSQARRSSPGRVTLDHCGSTSYHVTHVTPQEDELYVPDRFEGLVEAGSGSLRTIIVPVHSALSEIDSRFSDMRAARRGSLMILRGETGAGKSTFLDTVGLFRQGVVTERVESDRDIPEVLRELGKSEHPRLVVLDGREALGEVSRPAIEAAMHAINSFIRSARGRDTLVVWPTNTDDLTDLLQDFATTLGGEALVGTSGTVTRFRGPDRGEFVGIAERTVATLNRGASLVALGISEERAMELTEEAGTIGKYLALVRGDLIANQRQTRSLLPAEQYKLWVVVISGNDVEGDVAALTRGGYSFADIDRLMTATGANVVEELKKYPEKLGILATVLDARIVFLEMLTVLDAARQFGDEALHEQMKAAGMTTSRARKAAERILTSEIGVLLSGKSQGIRKRGGRPGSNTQVSYLKLAAIAQSNDGMLNKAIGQAMVGAGLIEASETEREFGSKLVFYSDLYCMQEGKPIRLEMMWRSKTSRAEIANYVLTKLNNYGRAIGFLD
jgi:hypothetical protein